MPQDARTIDATDLRLLAELQRDATITAQDLGECLNLSPSQAARRRQRLEAEGVVAGYLARLDPDRLGLKVQAFIQVQMAAHSPDAARDFARLLATLPQVVAAWTITGQSDYLLRVWCADLAELNRLVHGSLLPHPSVARVQSQIVMDQLKPEAGLPL
ncbi:Transcriptional regulator, AsnC family [Rubellimicrobium mesophilum DSM 19309]|uniref:Transcriptional regulator, AsnC family n=1 Tax=Rubellimicrobium mesophilum DSM 19309 TaxID=442562 RepID=A0A017HM71_9RHOB|nr:Lrp/AsnC family transcriptional regulator [Rubellimicrobium mesophilum]EYD74884.1 Transcriptional regulator, AsnC family [Rubellimicrobium mesophilum DSM 19309]